MKSSFSISIPGDWADGWLYKDQLLLWGENGDLCFMSLSSLTTHIRRIFGADIAFAAQLALFRNDWRSGEQASAYQRVEGIKRSISQALEAALAAVGDGEGIVLDDLALERVEVERVPGDILSTSIYANQAFVATSEGLFETNVNPRYLRAQGQLVERLSKPSHHVTANFGAVSASAFEEGLWFSTIDLDGSGGWRSGGPMDQVADYSRSTSTASRDLLNYTEDPVPDLFVASAVHERQSASSKFPSWQVRSYQPSEERLSTVAARGLGVDETEDTGKFEVLGNSNYHLLIDVGGRLVTLDMLNSPTGLSARALSEVADTNAGLSGRDVLSTVPMANGFAIERAHSVSWLGDDGVQELVAGQVAGVRSFPASRHFADTLLVVREADVLLIGLVDAS